VPPPPPSERLSGRQNPRRSKTVPLIVGLSLVVIIGICAAVILPMSLLGGGWTKCLLLNCYSNPSGPAAGWDEIMAAAQAEIARVDKTAVLHDIGASPIAYRPPNWDYQKVLEVEFRYISPTGDDISLKMRDDMPASTVKVTQRQAFDRAFYDRFALKQGEYASRLAAMKLGPRAAGELTWQDVLNHANGRKLSPMMILNLSEPAAQWHISYSDSDRGLFELWDMSFEVDAQTGAVLKADYTPFREQLQQAPASTP
jgi:hypothetical protein